MVVMDSDEDNYEASPMQSRLPLVEKLGMDRPILGVYAWEW